MKENYLNITSVDQYAKEGKTCNRNVGIRIGELEGIRHDHPYLVNNGVNLFGGKVSEEGDLLFPLHDANGTVHGQHIISLNGECTSIGKTSINGLYRAVGKPKDVILITKDYPSGATLYESTGHAVAITFGAEYIHVAKALRQKYSDKTLIICADIDQMVEGYDAAMQVNGLVVKPSFTNNFGKHKTFNDLQRLEGKEAVKEQIDAVISPNMDVFNPINPSMHKNSDQKEFLEPMVFGEIETPEISHEFLPSWLGAFCKSLAEFTQTPFGLSAMIALAVVGTCLQKLFVVSPFSGYREPLSIWTLVILPPGNRKTAVFEALTEPLACWEREEAGKLAHQIEEVRTKQVVFQKMVDSLVAKATKPDINSDEREDIFRQIKVAKGKIPKDVNIPCLFTDDITAESLQGLLSEHNERMAVLSDEGGIFETMTGLYNGGKVSINVFLQGHSGSKVRVHRQSRVVILNEPAVTFGLAVQPDVVNDFATGSKNRLRGLGATARFLYCVPVSTVGNRDVTRRIIIPDAIKSAYHHRITDLLNIPRIFDENMREQARTLTLSPDALKKWELFSQHIERNLGKGGELENMQDWAAKLPGAALRIAGLFHIVEHGAELLTINLQSIERAIGLCELLVSHARATFDLIGDDPTTKDAKEVYEWIVQRRLSSFHQNELYKQLRKFRTVDRLVKALKILIDRHIISVPRKVSTKGRPSIIYDVNPEIFSEAGSKGYEGSER